MNHSLTQRGRSFTTYLGEWRRVVLSLLTVLGLVALFPHVAFAHPMGNFSVNRYSRLTVGTERVELLYIVDMAEIPTHAERTLMDVNGDKEISAQEEQSYLTQVAEGLPAQLLLTFNGKATAWRTAERTIRFNPGQADLPTLRMEFHFDAPIEMVNKGAELHYVDESYSDRLGWKEVIVVPSSDAELTASDVPQSDLSNRLQEYPVGLLQNPPVVHEATISWNVAQNLSDKQDQQTNLVGTRGQTTTSLGGDGFAELVGIELGPWAVLLALLAAFGWGAAHALSPGHGKTIVAAYLVGARGTLAHALFLGATTTVTHTLGVFVLGLATLLASQYILPERIYPWLSTLSGVLVITIGLSIGWERVRSLWRGEPLHHHDHPHDHEHDHIHTHGAHTHTHMPPTANGGAVTWRGLLALGISGGLLPCPSALVVLLGAIALGRVGFGLLLILTFSLGLATVLTLFGLLLLRASILFERIPNSGRYARYLAIASAAFITLIGAGITVRALIETGLFSGLA